MDFNLGQAVVYGITARFLTNIEPAGAVIYSLANEGARQVINHFAMEIFNQRTSIGQYATQAAVFGGAVAAGLLAARQLGYRFKAEEALGLAMFYPVAIVITHKAADILKVVAENMKGIR